MNEAYANTGISDSPYIYYELFWYLFRLCCILGSILSLKVTVSQAEKYCLFASSYTWIIPLHSSKLLVSPEYI